MRMPSVRSFAVSTTPGTPRWIGSVMPDARRSEAQRPMTATSKHICVEIQPSMPASPSTV